MSRSTTKRLAEIAFAAALLAVGSGAILAIVGASPVKGIVESPSQRLEAFLQSPIVAMNVRYQSSGCHGGVQFENRFVAAGDYLSCIWSLSNYEKEWIKVGRVSELRSILHDIARDPESIPTVDDFAIDQSDIRGFHDCIRPRNVAVMPHLVPVAGMNLPYHYTLVTEALAEYDIKKLIDSSRVGSVTGGISTTVLIVNRAGDSLELYSSPEGFEAVLGLPWKVRLGNEFQSYSPKLSRYIAPLMPEGSSTHYFSNVSLLFALSMKSRNDASD